MDTNQIKNYDVLIIGAGISGLTLAERFANKLNKKVLIIEKRNHIGGNCYDFFDQNNILVPLYGPHFFHTNNTDIWEYVSQFTEWHNYEHRVLSNVDNNLVPVPVNINTVNKLFNLSIRNEDEMKKWLNKNVQIISNPKNSEESALSRVGKKLYEMMFKEYTKKQWDLWPKELDAEVMDRIPIRTNFEDRYFTDIYQAMPKDGYTKMFENMIKNKNIDLVLNTDWLKIRNTIKKPQFIFFTGPIDQYFNYDIGEKLEYRSLKFEFESINKEHYQEVTSVNFPSLQTPFTRITEPKFATGQKNTKTTIIKEYPTWDGEPYYPIPNQKNKNLYKKYQEKSKKLENEGIYFVGRLANYKYFNMDQAFLNALTLFKQIYEN